MVDNFTGGLRCLWSCIRPRICIFFWLIGSISGCLVFYSAPDLYISLMRSAYSFTVSIVRVVPIILFPFLILAFAMLYQKSILVHCICFICGFVFGVCIFAIRNSVGDGGWILQLLLMFTSNSVSVLLLYVSQIMHSRLDPKHILIVLALICMLVAIADTCFISQIAIASIL